MAEFPKIRGRTRREKDASIEHALRSISRRVASRAKVYIPPVPFIIGCNSAGENSLIGQTLVPFTGTMNGLFIRAGEARSSESRISLLLISGGEETRTSYTMTGKYAEFSVQKTLNAGALLQFTLEAGSLVDILIATAVYPEVTSLKSQTFLLEEILEQEKEQDDALQDNEKREG